MIHAKCITRLLNECMHALLTELNLIMYLISIPFLSRLEKTPVCEDRALCLKISTEKSTLQKLVGAHKNILILCLLCQTNPSADSEDDSVTVKRKIDR